MECSGRVVGLTKDWESDKFRITFEVNEDSIVKQEYDKIKDVEKMKLTFVCWKNRRSLDANAYFHVLVGKIAETLHISKPRCKNILIGRYGQIDVLEDGTPIVLKTNIPVSDMLEQEFLHCHPCGAKEENGNEVVFYRVYRGSHTYNTKEMSALIDGAVMEAKELGIETATPEELERMKEQWHL